MDFEWTALLAEQRVQALLKDALATEMELLPLSAKLAKTYAPAERAAIMDYYALLPRIFEKFGTDKFLLCDRLALEQSTAKDIAEWKARLFPGNYDVGAPEVVHTCDKRTGRIVVAIIARVRYGSSRI